jgi:hypothetical protein
MKKVGARYNDPLVVTGTVTTMTPYLVAKMIVIQLKKYFFLNIFMPEANTLVLLIIYKLSIIFVIQNWLTM